jgi:two component transcriptional regulator, AraC family
MDIKMPELNGLEASREIKSLFPNTKIIILTAYDDFKFAQAAIKLGISDYILKPAKPAEIVSVISKTISSIEASSGDNTDNMDKNTLISDAIDYINRNFNRNIDLESVSEYIHLNPQYFSRYFKSHIGMTFIDYITKLRIKRAKELLIKTDKSIKEISLEIGYTDAAYFSKVFSKHEGISPYKYRIDNKKTTITRL